MYLYKKQSMVNLKKFFGLIFIAEKSHFEVRTQELVDAILPLLFFCR